jgi:hypothetical protein
VLKSHRTTHTVERAVRALAAGATIRFRTGQNL